MKHYTYKGENDGCGQFYCNRKPISPDLAAVEFRAGRGKWTSNARVQMCVLAGRLLLKEHYEAAEKSAKKRTSRKHFLIGQDHRLHEDRAGWHQYFF